MIFQKILKIMLNFQLFKNAVLLRNILNMNGILGFIKRINKNGINFKIIMIYFHYIVLLINIDTK